MNKESGFTLVEVLITTLIFSIGLLAVASMQVTSIRGNNHSAALTEASYWAGGQMEQLLSRDYGHADLQDTDGDGTNQDGDNDGTDDDDQGNVVDGVKNFGLDQTAGAADGTLPPNGIYSVSWNVAMDVAVTNTKTVKVIVNWTERGSQKKLALEGIKAR